MTGFEGGNILTPDASLSNGYTVTLPPEMMAANNLSEAMLHVPLHTSLVVVVPSAPLKERRGRRKKLSGDRNAVETELTFVSMLINRYMGVHHETAGPEPIVLRTSSTRGQTGVEDFLLLNPGIIHVSGFVLFGSFLLHDTITRILYSFFDVGAKQPILPTRPGRGRARFARTETPLGFAFSRVAIPTVVGRSPSRPHKATLSLEDACAALLARVFLWPPLLRASLNPISSDTPDAPDTPKSKNKYAHMMRAAYTQRSAFTLESHMVWIVPREDDYSSSSSALSSSPADASFEFDNYIPDELLLEIFQMLTVRERFRARKVCHRWARVGADASLYRTIRLAEFAGRKGRRAGDKELAILLSSSVVTDNMRTLDLEGTDVNVDSLSVLPSRVPGLWNLSLFGMTMYSLDPLMKMVKELESLRSLTVTTTYIRPQTLIELGEIRPEVAASLAIDRITRFSRIGYDDVIFVDDCMYRVESMTESSSGRHRTFVFFLVPVLPPCLGIPPRTYTTSDSLAVVYNVKIESFLMTGPAEWRPRLFHPETGLYVKRTPHRISREMYDAIQLSWEMAGSPAPNTLFLPVELHTFGPKSALSPPIVLEELPPEFDNWEPDENTPHPHPTFPWALSFDEDYYE